MASLFMGKNKNRVRPQMGNIEDLKETSNMNFIGKLLSIPVRIINSPARMVEKLVDPNSKHDDEDNILSKPLEKLAQALEEVDEDERQD